VCAGVSWSAIAVPEELENASVNQLADWIVEGGTASETRRMCADQLVQYAVDRKRGANRAVVSMLDKDRPLHARQAVLLAIARCEEADEVTVLADATLTMRTSLPAEMEEVWARTLGRLEFEDIARDLAEIAGDEQVELEQRRLAIRALGEHRRLFGAKPLMELTSVNRLPQVQAWAYDALANLSHQDKLGQDRAAWAQWYNEASDLNAGQWQRMLHENLLQQVRSKNETDNRVRDRLVQAQRALHRATAPEQRQALLVELLQDPLDASRSLAMDLVRQRAEDGGEFGPVLREQLRARLDDKLARVREESSTLLGQLLDQPGADLIADRLAGGEEGASAVEQAYLVALTQMPRAKALRPGYEMLDNPLLEASAAGMLAAAHRAKQGEEAFWQDVRDRTREQLDGVDSPSPQMVTLLGLVVEEDDDTSWKRIGAWLIAKDDRVREAAARVWADSSKSLSVLAERSDDVVIRPIALKAIAERGTLIETLKGVAKRRPTEADDVRLWEQAMIAMASRVKPALLMEVINGLADKNGETRQVRERMLTAGIDQSATDDQPTRESLSLLLARARVRVLADAPALVVLDYEAVLQHPDKLNEAQLYNARRGLAMAYLADSRIDDTLRMLGEILKPKGDLVDGANNDALLPELIAAANAAIEQGRAPDADKLVSGLRLIFGEALSAANAERLANIEAKIKALADDTPAPN